MAEADRPPVHFETRIGMAYNYAVIGAGRQGTAAAYDMARFGEARSILLIDQDESAADRACVRVNRLIGREVAAPAAVTPQVNRVASRAWITTWNCWRNASRSSPMGIPPRHTVLWIRSLASGRGWSLAVSQ